MKNTLVRISMLAALAAGLSYAQSDRLTADVPFQFTVGNKSLPAGSYEVNPSLITHMVAMRAAGAPPVASVGIHKQSSHIQDVSKLVFHRYGNRYFLAEVWTRGSDQGWQIPVSSLERELIARRAVPPQQVLVAMR